MSRLSISKSPDAEDRAAVAALWDVLVREGHRKEATRIIAARKRMSFETVRAILREAGRIPEKVPRGRRNERAEGLACSRS